MQQIPNIDSFAGGFIVVCRSRRSALHIPCRVVPYMCCGSLAKYYRVVTLARFSGPQCGAFGRGTGSLTQSLASSSNRSSGSKSSNSSGSGSGSSAEISTPLRVRYQGYY